MIIIGMSAAVPYSIKQKLLFSRRWLQNAIWRQSLTTYVTRGGEYTKNIIWPYLKTFLQ